MSDYESEDSFNRYDEEDDQDFNDEHMNEEYNEDEMDVRQQNRNNINGLNTTGTATTAISKSSSSPSAQLAFEEDEYKRDYIVMNERQLRSSMNLLVKDVATICATSLQMSSLLLRNFQWSKEKVMAAYFEDPEIFVKKLGLQFIQAAGDEVDEEIPNTTSTSIDGDHRSAAESDKLSNATEEVTECRICDDEFPLSEMWSAGCFHHFCKNCAREYLTSQLTSGRQSTVSKCPSYQCNTVVPDRAFHYLLPAEDSARYDYYLLRSYVEDNPNMKWCPGASCANAFEAFSSSVHDVECPTCHTSFCFQCDEENHAPATCEQLRAWKQKLSTESDTAHWIIANTHKCPKCMVRIEKNQGCNHITCRSCKHEWCWVCGNPWSEHGNHTGGFYRCNKFDPKATKNTSLSLPDSVTDADSTKAELTRYLFYFQRYHNHEQSRKFADFLRKAAEKRINALQERSQDDAYIDFTFLSQASSEIMRCRHVLKYTYVYAFYITDEHEKTLFEYLQQQLEASTETLSEMSEAPLEKLDRANLLNFCGVVKQFRQNLLEGVERGLTKSA